MLLYVDGGPLVERALPIIRLARFEDTPQSVGASRFSTLLVLPAAPKHGGDEVTRARRLSFLVVLCAILQTFFEKTPCRRDSGNSVFERRRRLMAWFDSHKMNFADAPPIRLFPFFPLRRGRRFGILITLYLSHAQGCFCEFRQAVGLVSRMARKRGFASALFQIGT